jgi:cation diffusion facilitator CzcD-associated flavoprotein CzcO
VFYGAATSEAKAMKDREVFVVGSANSAGQAAVHLARYAAKVTVLVGRCWWLADLGASSAGSDAAGDCRVTAG